MIERKETGAQAVNITYLELTMYTNVRTYASMRGWIEQMRSQAAVAEGMLKSLASRHRLMILCRLIDGERPVGELAEFLEVRASTVSQHLALLRKDGIVSARRDGQTIWYTLASEPVRRLVGALYDIYCGPRPIYTPVASSKTRLTRRVSSNDIHKKLRTR